MHFLEVPAIHSEVGKGKKRKTLDSDLLASPLICACIYFVFVCGSHCQTTVRVLTLGPADETET